MAKHGFGLCKQIKEYQRAHYKSAHASCEKHTPASQEVIDKRREYLEKKRC